jgi:hypothetical protein
VSSVVQAGRCVSPDYRINVHRLIKRTNIVTLNIGQVSQNTFQHPSLPLPRFYCHKTHGNIELLILYTWTYLFRNGVPSVFNSFTLAVGLITCKETRPGNHGE